MQHIPRQPGVLELEHWLDVRGTSCGGGRGQPGQETLSFNCKQSTMDMSGGPRGESLRAPETREGNVRVQMVMTWARARAQTLQEEEVHQL